MKRAEKGHGDLGCEAINILHFGFIFELIGYFLRRLETPSPQLPISTAFAQVFTDDQLGTKRRVLKSFSAIFFFLFLIPICFAFWHSPNFVFPLLSLYFYTCIIGKCRGLQFANCADKKAKSAQKQVNPRYLHLVSLEKFYCSCPDKFCLKF